jgi:hypothetical protein
VVRFISTGFHNSRNQFFGDFVQIRKGTQAHIHRILGFNVLHIPMGAVPNFGNGIFGGANQF